MIASLPMYEFPHTVAANDRLWAGIRDRLRAAGCAAPDALTRGEADIWQHWTAPDLILSQTCGFPFRARLHDRVTLVGTPDYGLEGCGPGEYRSVFVARRDDPRAAVASFDGASLAYNDDMSQSGWAAPQTHAARLGIRLQPGVRTGAHRLSAAAVAEGRADIASLDAVTWRLLACSTPLPGSLKVVGITDPTPGLPLIAARGADADLLFEIVSAAIAGMPEDDREATGLRGLVRIPAARYLAVPTPPAPAELATGG